MNELSIVYNNGHGKMNIYMGLFFPYYTEKLENIESH